MSQVDDATPPLQRIGSLIGLVGATAEEYVRLHAAVWPEVLAALSNAHITNYSIFHRGELLFSYMEYRGGDLAADMAVLAQDAATQRWWEVVMPMQNTLRTQPDEDWWVPMEEVFHLD